MIPELSVDDLGCVRASELLEELTMAPAVRPGSRGAPRPTGFHPLDEVLDGGVRAGELTVVGGPPGVGKTVLALQWARHLAVSGSTVLYASYEHRPEDMLWRMLVSEAAGPDGVWEEHSSLDDRRRQHLRDAIAGRAISSVVRIHPGIATACERFVLYGDRIELLNGAATRTDVELLERLVVDRSDANRVVLVVDSIQKVTPRHGVKAHQQTADVAQQLKDLALRHDVAVIGVASTRVTAGRPHRARLPDLLGAGSLAYDADVVLMLEEKLRALSRVHLGYGGGAGASPRDKVVLTLEKNRSGPAGVDMEFDKDLANFRFDPRGCLAAGQLVDGIEVLE